MPAQPGPRPDQLAQRNAVVGNVLTAGPASTDKPLAVPSYQEPTGSGIAFFGSGDTQAQVQAALDDPTIQIVYIETGAAIAFTTTLTVPIGKTLSGTANKNQHGAGGTVFDLEFTGNSVISARSANLMDLAIKRTNDWNIATGFIDSAGVPGGRVQGCHIEVGGAVFAGTRQVIRSSSGSGCVIRDILIRMIGSADPQGIHISTDPSFNRSILSGVTIRGSSGGVTQHGIVLAGGSWGIENCSISNCGGDGYNLDFSTNSPFCYVRNCEADNCNVNGFNVVTFTGTFPAWIQSCWATGNTLIGFNVPQNGIPQPGVLSHCRAVNNTPDFTIGTLWASNDNQTI